MSDIEPKRRLVVQMDKNLKQRIQLKALLLEQSMEEIARACIFDALELGDHHLEKLLQNYKNREAQ